MTNKKRILNKKGDISAILVALVFVVIALIAIPAFKSMQNKNSESSKKSETQYNTFITETDTFINGGASTEKPFQ